jgi:hypothetical protein
MAFIWLDTEGNGLAVQETARTMKDRFEEDEGMFLEALIATGTEENPWRTIFVDKASVVAIESGSGYLEEAS